MTSNSVNVKIVASILAVALLLVVLLLVNTYSDTDLPTGGNKPTANKVDSEFGRKVAESSDCGQPEDSFEDNNLPPCTTEPDEIVLEKPPAEDDKPATTDKPVIPAKLVAIKYDVKPLIDWNTDETEYRRISQDESLSDEVRSDARTKLNYRFAEWRGRKRGRLGGFEFDLADYSLLQGWIEVINPKREAVRVFRHSEPLLIEKIIGLKIGEAETGEAWLSIRIRLTISVGRAHQLILDRKTGATNSSGYTDWGELHGVKIGDVSFSGPRKQIQKSITDDGRLAFARRNVIIDVEFSNRNGSRHKLDVIRLARQLDAQIIEQGLPGYKWSDISEHCPKIIQFEAESNTLTVGGDTFSPYEKDRAKAGSKNYSLVKFKVEPEHDGDKVSWVGVSDGAVRMILKYAIPYAGTGYLEPSYLDNNPSTAKVWLVAINERNLLFSIAEIEFTLIKPD